MSTSLVFTPIPNGFVQGDINNRPLVSVLITLRPIDDSDDPGASDGIDLIKNWPTIAELIQRQEHLKVSCTKEPGKTPDQGSTIITNHVLVSGPSDFSNTPQLRALWNALFVNSGDASNDLAFKASTKRNDERLRRLNLETLKTPRTTRLTQRLRAETHRSLPPTPAEFIGPLALDVAHTKPLSTHAASQAFLNAHATSARVGEEMHLASTLNQMDAKPPPEDKDLLEDLKAFLQGSAKDPKTDTAAHPFTMLFDNGEIDFSRRMGQLIQYPRLLRFFGLLFDIELPHNFNNDSPAYGFINVECTVSSTLGGNISPRYCWTTYERGLGKKKFFLPITREHYTNRNAPEDYLPGWLEMLTRPAEGNLEQKFIPVIFDAAGSFLRVASNGSRKDVAEEWKDPVVNRSTGIAVARNSDDDKDTAKIEAVDSINRQKLMKDTVAGDKPYLYAEDICRGYRFDIQSTKTSIFKDRWRSLHWRKTELSQDLIEVKDRWPEGFYNENWVASSISEVYPKNSETPECRASDMLIRWDGWGLATLHPLAKKKEPATNRERELPITAHHQTIRRPIPQGVPGLDIPPPLRFGWTYALSAREVYMNGGGPTVIQSRENIDVGNKRHSIKVKYLRYEPIHPPLLINPSLREKPSNHDIQTIPLDSSIGKDPSIWYAMPPESAPRLAEIHGFFDGLSREQREQVRKRFGGKIEDVLESDDAKPKVTYLPDPLAEWMCVNVVDAQGESIATCAPLSWVDQQSPLVKNVRPIEITVAEGIGQQVLEVTGEGKLTIRVSPGSRLPIRLNSRPVDLDGKLKLMAAVAELGEEVPDRFTDSINQGDAGIVAPAEEIEVVYPVKSPLANPEIDGVNQMRPALNSTSILMETSVAVHGASTGVVSLKFESHTWEEDLAEELVVDGGRAPLLELLKDNKAPWINQRANAVSVLGADTTLEQWIGIAPPVDAAKEKVTVPGSGDGGLFGNSEPILIPFKREEPVDLQSGADTSIRNSITRLPIFLIRSENASRLTDVRLTLVDESETLASVTCPTIEPHGAIVVDCVDRKIWRVRSGQKFPDDVSEDSSFDIPSNSDWESGEFGRAHWYYSDGSSDSAIEEDRTRASILFAITEAWTVELGTTKRVNFTLAAVASSPFGGYFEGGAGRKESPAKEGLSARSTAPPLPPSIRYAIPTFEDTKVNRPTYDPSKQRSDHSRLGRGLRVFLDRGWFSSGQGEKLVAILPNDPEDMLDERSDYVSCWGMDPTTTPGNLAPTPRIESEEPYHPHTINLAGLDDPVSVDLVDLELIVDQSRDCYFADIVFEGINAYMPFVRLALARYQDHALPGAKLSPISVVDYIQVLPDRTVTVTTHTLARKYDVLVTGPAPNPGGAGENELKVSVEEFDEGEWKINNDIEVDIGPFSERTKGGGWSFEVDRGKLPRRLRIAEYELLKADNKERSLVEDSLQTFRRLIFGRVIGLTQMPTDAPEPSIKSPVTPPTDAPEPSIKSPVTPPTDAPEPSIKSPVTPPSDAPEPSIKPPVTPPSDGDG